MTVANEVFLSGVIPVDPQCGVSEMSFKEDIAAGAGCVEVAAHFVQDVVDDADEADLAEAALDDEVIGTLVTEYGGQIVRCPCGG